jgi:hypothetical protein
MSAGQLQQVIGAVSVATSGQSEHNKYGIKLMVLGHK